MVLLESSDPSLGHWVLHAVKETPGIFLPSTIIGGVQLARRSGRPKTGEGPTFFLSRAGIWENFKLRRVVRKFWACGIDTHSLRVKE